MCLRADIARGESTFSLLSQGQWNFVQQKKLLHAPWADNNPAKKRRINTQMNKNKHKEIIIIITHTSNGTPGASDNTKALLIQKKIL